MAVQPFFAREYTPAEAGREVRLKKGGAGRYFLSAAALVITVLSIWGPEALAEYKDRAVLNQIRTQEASAEGEGYRYRLGSAEKLHILSKCLESQMPSEGGAEQGEASGDYQEGTFAFIINHRGPSGKEITEEQIYMACEDGLIRLKELGILPQEVQRIEEEDYDAVLYSAIDVPDPQNNVAVWKISLSASQANADRKNRLIDAYIDADDGRIYEFYARTSLSWEEIDPDEIMRQWSAYMDLGEVQTYGSDNPLMESTPYYKKYSVLGAGGERTIVTIGFYEGINELFLKVS